MPKLHRLLPLFTALLATTGAAPAPFPPIVLTAQPPGDAAPALGSPYTSPYTPAPVPNIDLQGPARTEARAGPELTPGIYRPSTTYRGDGYTPGSTVQGEENRHYKPLPSLRLSVPLE